MKHIVAEYIRFIEGDGRVLEYDSLMSLLSKLVYEYYSCDDVYDDTEYDCPKLIEYAEAHRFIGARFPELGFYSMVIDPTAMPDAVETGLDDAIDDLADIYIDMKEVYWRFENTSSIDAIWHFRFGYSAHWGAHAHSLMFYLHDRFSNS